MSCDCTLLAPQVVTRVLWLKQTLEEAILAKRLHHQLFPNVIKWEPGFPQVRYLTYCFTSTEARSLIRDRDGRGGGGRGRESSKGSTAETARKRPERPWTAARTMEVLRPCPLSTAQRLVHCAIAVSTAVLGRVTKTMSRRYGTRSQAK